jgi:hypothetical protein
MTVTPSPLSKLPLLLLVLLLTPAAGLASTQDAPQEPAAQEETLSPAQELQEEEAVEPKQYDRPVRLLEDSELPRPRAPRGGRIAAELGLGLLTGAAGAVAGTFVVGALACRSSFAGCLIGAVLGGGLGLAFASSAGVWWAGDLSGADGTYGSALLGSLVGVAVAIPLLYVGPLGYLGLVAPLVGAVIGYGMSISPEPESPAMALLGRTRLQPLLSVSPQGSFVGLGGRF